LKIKGLLSIGIADILGSGIGSIFWFLIATQIEPESFGEIYYFIGIASIASYIALIGSQDTITVYVAKKIKIQSTLNFLSLILGGISFIVIIIIFNRVDTSLLLLAFVINTLAIGDLLGSKNYSNYSKYFLTQKILLLIFGFSFYYLFGVEGILYAVSLSYGIFVIRVIKGFKESKIDFSLLKPRIGFIANNYMLRLADNSKNQIDKLIIAPILGFALLGNYALAIQIIGIFFIFSQIVFKYTLSEDSTGNKNKKLKEISILFSIGIAIIGFFLSPIIIPELFPKYIEAISAIQIMVFSTIPVSVGLIYKSKILSLEKSKFVLIGTLGSLVTIIIGMVVLGTIFGIIGLAIAFVLAVSVEAIILFLSTLKIDQKLRK
jgi:O-antigen/teichoic acid export membrane protein